MRKSLDWSNKMYMIRGISIKPSRISNYRDETRYFVTRIFIDFTIRIF